MAQKKNPIRQISTECLKLFKTLFRRDFIKEDILEQPRPLRKMVLKLKISDFIFSDIIGTFMAYLLIGANHFIQIGYPIIGIILFFLYVGRSIFTVVYRQYYDNLNTQINFTVMDTIMVKGGDILSKVSFNVYQKEKEYYEQASNETIVDSIGKYLDTSWKIKNQYWFNVIKLVTVGIMLVATVKTNESIPQNIFIPLLFLSTIAAFFTSLSDCIFHKEYVKNSRDIDRKKSTMKNDIMRVVPIIPFDQQTRIRRYQNLASKTLVNEKSMRKHDFVTDIISRSVHIAASFMLIIFTILNTSEITLETIALLTASLAVFNSAVNTTHDMIRILQKNSDAWDIIDKEIELMSEVLKVYHKQEAKQTEAIDSLDLKPFSIVYEEQSENDKPFNLILQTPLQFQKGDIVALTGSSGSGKSTFGKLVTNRISFNHIEGNEIYPTNYMFYDETINFGSLSLFDELFCLDDVTRPEPTAYEIEKMQFIFEKLFLWKELSEGCKDVWAWLKEHNSRMLSNGQKQRMVMAKILFWLSDDIDIIMLDECTSGLDADNGGDLSNADALRVLQFIIDYCNEGKKRILFISTHQKIEELCNRRLHFQKNNGQTIVQEIS